MILPKNLPNAIHKGVMHEEDGVIRRTGHGPHMTVNKHMRPSVIILKTTVTVTCDILHACLVKNISLYFDIIEEVSAVTEGSPFQMSTITPVAVRYGSPVGCWA